MRGWTAGFGPWAVLGRTRAWVAWLLIVALAAPAWSDRLVLETAAGTIEIALFPDQAPATVKLISTHVQAGYYSGLVFHRVIPGMLIQTGGYDASGSYREPMGQVVNESIGGLPNKTGTVAMARTSDPDSGSSQFYINLMDRPDLNAMRTRPGYTVFGQVVSGLDVAQRIAQAPTQDGSSVPVNPVAINRARIVAETTTP